MAGQGWMRLVDSHGPCRQARKETAARSMNRLNIDPIVTFSDGGQLLVSTTYCGEGSFACELYMAYRVGHEGKMDLRTVSNLSEAPTCRQAQEGAYAHARQLYPGTAEGMKKPPYLIWTGPSLPSVEPDARSRSAQRRHE